MRAVASAASAHRSKRAAAVAARRRVSARRCSRPSGWNAQYGVAAITSGSGGTHRPGTAPGARSPEPAHDPRVRAERLLAGDLLFAHRAEQAGEERAGRRQPHPAVVAGQAGDDRVGGRQRREAGHVVAQPCDRVGPLDHPVGAGAVPRRAHHPARPVPVGVGLPPQRQGGRSVRGGGGPVEGAADEPRARVVPAQRQQPDAPGEVVGPGRPEGAGTGGGFGHPVTVARPPAAVAAGSLRPQRADHLDAAAHRGRPQQDVDRDGVDAGRFGGEEPALGAQRLRRGLDVAPVHQP